MVLQDSQVIGKCLLNNITDLLKHFKESLNMHKKNSLSVNFFTTL